jgi:hypothetical protein
MPLLQDHSETLIHVFFCEHALPTSCRHQALKTLCDRLIEIGTPEPLVSAISHGITTWSQSAENNPATKFVAPTAQSVRPSDIHITHAYAEQSRDIGWDQLLRGRISTKWASAYRCLKGGNRRMDIDTAGWGKHMILPL